MVTDEYLKKSEARQILGPMLLTMMKLMTVGAMSARGPSDEADRLSKEAGKDVTALIAKMQALGLIEED